MRPSAIEAHSVAYFGEAPKPFLLNGARRGSQGLAHSGVMAAWGESCGSDVWHHGWKGHNWDNRVGTWHDDWWYDDGLWYDWRHEDGWPEREQGQVFGSSEPASSKPLRLPAGRVNIKDVKQCEKPSAVRLKRKREKPPQWRILGKAPQRTSKLIRAMKFRKATNLSTFLECPFESNMDITFVHSFWGDLDNNQVLTALWSLLTVLFEIVQKWKINEIDAAKFFGIGTDARKAILWHLTEFMTEAHIKRIRTSLRRELSSTATQSINMAMDAQQRARLQESAVEERNTTIETFLRDRIFPMIRLGKWTEPTNPAKWPHYDDFRKVTGEYWEREDGRTITARKASFQTLVWEVFCDIVRTEKLRPYHGSIRTSILSILNEAEGNPDGDADCISGVDDAVQGDDLEAKRKFYEEKATEASNATTVLQKMSWLHSCPDTPEHWVCFKAIMNFCRDFIRNPQMHAIQDFMLKEDFPSSMRAWCIMPWAALRILKKRGRYPTFLAAPTDTDIKIKHHADLAPDFYQDPGNNNLDLTFYLLSLWEFMNPEVLPDILKISWKDYGPRGEKSSERPMSFRGNVLEALLGYCHEHSIKVSGYHAGRFSESKRRRRFKTDDASCNK